MKTVFDEKWVRELTGLLCYLGLVAVVIEWTRRLITDPRALVKYVAKLVRYPFALVVVIAAVFATWAVFAIKDHWWESFFAMLLGGAGIMIWFSLMMAPMFIGFGWLDELMKWRKEKSVSSKQNTL